MDISDDENVAIARGGEGGPGARVGVGDGGGGGGGSGGMGGTMMKHKILVTAQISKFGPYVK